MGYPLLRDDSVPCFIAKLAEAPKFKSKSGLSKAQKAGYVFQENVLEALVDGRLQFADNSFTLYYEQWISYVDAQNQGRVSRPDIVLVWEKSRKILLIECKLNHSRLALAQYAHYSSLLKAIYPHYKISGLEISKTYDPFEAAWPLVRELKDEYTEFSTFLWV